jgi:hypothetical protein
MALPLVLGSCIGLAGFAVYVETNPKIGGVWLRPDSEGKIVVCPRSFFNLTLQPFKNAELWKIKNWDINVCTWLAGGVVLGKIVPCLDGLLGASATSVTSSSLPPPPS